MAKKLTPAQKRKANELAKLKERVSDLEAENMELKMEKERTDTFKLALGSFLNVNGLIDEMKEEIRDGIDDQIRDEVDSRVSDLTIS